MLPSLANILVTLFPGANVTGETHPDTAPIKTDAARIGADWYNKFNRAVAGPKLCYCLVGVICYPYALAIEGQSPRAVHREGTQDSAIARAQLGQTGIVRPATLIWRPDIGAVKKNIKRRVANIKRAERRAVASPQLGDTFETVVQTRQSADPPSLETTAGQGFLLTRTGGLGPRKRPAAHAVSVWPDFGQIV